MIGTLWTKYESRKQKYLVSIVLWSISFTFTLSIVKILNNFVVNTFKSRYILTLEVHGWQFVTLKQSQENFVRLRFRHSQAWTFSQINPEDPPFSHFVHVTCSMSKCHTWHLQVKNVHNCTWRVHASCLLFNFQPTYMCDVLLEEYTLMKKFITRFSLHEDWGLVPLRTHSEESWRRIWRNK